MKGNSHRGGHILKKTYNNSKNTEEKRTWNLLEVDKLSPACFLASSVGVSVLVIYQEPSEWNCPILTTHSFIHATSTLTRSTVTCGQRMGPSPMEHQQRGCAPSLARTPTDSQPLLSSSFDCRTGTNHKTGDWVIKWLNRGELKCLTDSMAPLCEWERNIYCATNLTKTCF